jgi:general secretion pathway protein I
MVAMAILGLALMAIFDLNAGAVASHGYTKRLTVATLLARSKMTDLEQELMDEGFPLDDKEMNGDFSEEGWESFKWRAKVIAPKTSGVSPEQLMGALFNIPMGGGEEGASGDPLSALAQMMGGSSGQGGTGALPPGASPAGGLGALGGMASGMMQQQFNQMLQQISQSVREVHLTVSWKDGTLTESVDLVTHVVSAGKGSDRNAQGNTLPRPPGTPGAPGTPGLPGGGSLPPGMPPPGPGGLLPGMQRFLNPGGLGVPPGRPLR